MAVEGSTDCGAVGVIEDEVSPGGCTEHVVRRGLPDETNESVFVRGNKYTVLQCIGQGGSSKVFQVGSC